MSENSTQLPHDDDGKLITYAWPGGYPVYYITADGGTLCSGCARMAEDDKLSPNSDDAQWHIVTAGVNYEDDLFYCDHCSERIESAYGEDDEPADDMSCDQCVAAMINGVYCHETGCPNTRKIKVNGEWVQPEPDDAS